MSLTFRSAGITFFKSMIKQNLFSTPLARSMSYKSLEIYRLSDSLAIQIHKMTLQDLPAFEKYETGSQIRRSIKSVKSNIVEGYGRRLYKQDFLHFLVIAQASLDETADHLDTLFKTNSLTDQARYEQLAAELTSLGKKLTNFVKAVRKNHRQGPAPTN